MFAGLAARQRSGRRLSKTYSGSGPRQRPSPMLNTAAGRAGADLRPGWSFDNGGGLSGCARRVAAPVFNANNDLTAAISVVGTGLQINEDNRDYLAGKAIACAKDISTSAGGGKALRNNSPHH